MKGVLRIPVEVDSSEVVAGDVVAFENCASSAVADHCGDGLAALFEVTGPASLRFEDKAEELGLDEDESEDDDGIIEA